MRRTSSVKKVLAALLAGALGFLGACTGAPRPSARMRELERGPKVLVSGRVMDAVTGAPVAGIEVLGLPRGKDIPWMKPARTDVEGRFTLSLPAGVSYAFCLRSRGISVVTPRADDPGYVDIETEPGMDISGIRLKFFREEFERH